MTLQSYIFLIYDVLNPVNRRGPWQFHELSSVGNSCMQKLNNMLTSCTHALIWFCCEVGNIAVSFTWKIVTYVC